MGLPDESQSIKRAKVVAALVNFTNKNEHTLRVAFEVSKEAGLDTNLSISKLIDSMSDHTLNVLVQKFVGIK